MSPVSSKTLAFLAQVEPWNYASLQKNEEPVCPCCRRPVEKGASRVKVHKDTFHYKCHMYGME